MTETHSARATISLQKLAEKDKAFASLSLWCNHRDTRTLDLSETGLPEQKVLADLARAPAWTDGKTIFYSARFATWPLSIQMGVAAHEITHVAFRHPARGRKLRERLGPAYNHEIFNIAIDAITNEMLRLAGFSLPENAIYLTELLKESFDEKVSAEEAIGAWDAETLYMRLMKDEKGGSGGNGGSGGGGQSAADKARSYAKSHDFHPDIHADGKSSPEDGQEESEWQQRLQRALAHGHQAGSGLGTLGHKIADIPKSRTPWEILLRRAINKAVTRSPRPTYTSPAKRWIGAEDNARRRGTPTPAFEPGFVKQNMRPRVAVCVDVSGSIGDNELSIFCGEIASIGKKTGAELHVIVFDTSVRSCTKMDGIDFEAEVKKLEFARGGGTSFVEMMDKAVSVEPSIIVVLTDLYGPFGPEPRGVPVIWASPNDHPPEPPFGRLISITA